MAENKTHNRITELPLESDLYNTIIRDFLDTRSIKKTSDNLNVSEVRVRKVLLTEGIWSSRTSVLVKHYLDEGKTSEEIAEIMSISVKAVQQYLPYSRGLYNGNMPSAFAVYSAEYRNRIRTAQEKTLKKVKEILKKEGWDPETPEREIIKNEREDKDMAKSAELHFPQYPGIVCLRELPENMKPSRYKAKNVDVIRLHLELLRKDVNFEEFAENFKTDILDREYDEETRVLKTYGNVQYGESITRDVLVPADIPLFAVHYMIQALFGWENSHLHRFELPLKSFYEITRNSAQKWMQLVGVLFRSPCMDESDEFWADDYENGSFKVWLRKKYTGPYVSWCHGEGIIQCKKDVETIKEKYPLIEVAYIKHGSELQVAHAHPAPKGAKPGKLKVSEKHSSVWNRIDRKEVLRLEDCSAEVMRMFFLEEGADKLLERLPIEEVLALHGKSPDDHLAEAEEICGTFEEFMDEYTIQDIADILESGQNSPYVQPVISTMTDELLYFYDFGDGWQIRITGSYDACDLVAAGRITQEKLDQAIKKVYETYRPVCIAADGLPLVDDVGGISGYVRFLRSLHPEEEKQYWGEADIPDNWSYDDVKGSLEWAKSLGWKDKVSPGRLL